MNEQEAGLPQEGEHWYRHISDAMPQLIFTAQPDGRVDYFNRQWMDYTGMSLDESKQGGWAKAIHPEDLPALSGYWEESLRTGRDHEFAFRLRRGLDGVFRWYLGRLFPFRDEAGRIVQWVGTLTDIEDRKRDEAALERRVAERTAELVEARQQLHRVLEGATNVGIIATDLQGVITVFNCGAERILGYRAEELLGRHTPRVYHFEPEIAGRARELKAELGREISGFEVFVHQARLGTAEEREWIYVRKDGSHVPVNLVVTPLRGEIGEIVGFMGVATDLSARKAAESAARISDRRYRLIEETVQDFVLTMLDPAGLVVSWSAGAERMKGYRADEVLGRHFSIFYREQDIARGHPEEELRIAASEGRYAEEGWRVRKDGSEYMAGVLISAIRDGTGKLVGFSKVVHDISKRRHEEERFQLAVEASPNAMLMAGEDGRIFLVNTQAETLFGYDRYEILGESIDMLLPDRFRTAHGGLVQEFFRTPSSRSMGAGRDLFGRHKDGTEVPIEIGLNPIQTVDGVFVLASIIDITERKRQEREERERTTQLMAANKALEEFAYIASHDLKAPLRVIDNASMWLEEDLREHITGEARESLDLMRSRIRRMEKLLDDLLEYARAGRVQDSRYGEVIRGTALTGDILALLDPKDFTVKVGEGFARIQVPRMPLQQILMNLIGNAIKHHDRTSGTIEVTVEDSAQEGGEMYAFTVKDDGPGIAPKFHEQVFKMFQTLKPRDQVEGSGMGLALVKKHLEIWGGTIVLESNGGRGTAFHFTWPKQAWPKQAWPKQAGPKQAGPKHAEPNRTGQVQAGQEREEQNKEAA